MFSRSDVTDAIGNARAAAQRTGDRLQGRAGDVIDDVRDRLPAAEDFLGSLADMARRLANERPVATLATVGLLGILIGLACRRRD
jgi:hypothetical protein